MEQEFGIGDIAKLDDDFIVKVVDVMEDDDGFYYEVELVGGENLIHREVMQSRLSQI